GVKRVMTLMFPALLGVSVNQLNLLLSTLFASFLPTGSVSWLYYAERLMEFPSGGFGVALATVVLPHLSRHRATADTLAFSQTVDWGLRWVLLVAFPAAIGLGMMAGPLIVTLFMYQSGHFDVEDALMTQKALWAYAPGVLGFMVAKVLASAYYACQDIKTPVKIAIVTVLVNVLGNLAFVSSFAHQGLAMATSLSALFNATTLGILLLRRRMMTPEPGWVQYLLRLLASGGMMIAGLCYFSPALSHWVAWSTPERIAHLVGLIAMSMVLYATTLWISGLRKHHLLQPLQVQVAEK
ncbi:MAG: putative lipid flippase MurJ, partial [Pseudomonadota bacterium]